MSNAVHNNDGRTAISAFLAGEGVTGANQRAILIGSPDGFRTVARLGDTLTFNGQDYEVGWLDNRVVLNDSGQAAFLAALREPGSLGERAYAPLLYSDGALHLIAKDGDQLAPQLPGREFTAINPPCSTRAATSCSGRTLMSLSAACRTNGPACFATVTAKPKPSH